MAAPTSAPARLAVALVVLVVGAATGICAVALHERWWGLALGLAATSATLAALPGGWWSRLPFGVGFVLVLAPAADQRPEGDYLIASDAQGYLLLGAGLAVLLASLVGVRRRPAGASSSETGAPAP